MDFALFPIGATNIFPLANSTVGGQLLTEYNIRSRESVSTDPNVEYFIGPSFVHSENDFLVSLSDNHPDETLVISSGRAVINGHYVELQNDIEINMTDLNKKVVDAGGTAYKGKLAIGIRAVYSTETTLAGSMLPEYFETPAQQEEREAAGLPDPEEAGMYRGLHIVILPASQFKTPSDVPTQPESVTAHLKLAEFIYKSKVIVSDSLVQNPDRLTFIDGSRIANIDDIISDDFITTAGINLRRMYVYSGRVDGSGNLKPGWCDATNSLMVWDNATLDSMETAESAGAVPSEATDPASFETRGDTISLRVPHRQIDTFYPLSSGGVRYYPPKYIDLPKMDYLRSLPGTVTEEFIRRVQRVEKEYRDIYTHSYGVGRLRKYIYEPLTDRDEQLPKPQESGWEVGDYVLVRYDETVAESEGSQPPSTLYPVIPGYVGSIEYYEPEYTAVTSKPADWSASYSTYYNRYKQLTEKPSDWDTAYSTYYVKSGTTFENNIEPNWNTASADDNIYEDLGTNYIRNAITDWDIAQGNVYSVSRPSGIQLDYKEENGVPSGPSEAERYRAAAAAEANAKGALITLAGERIQRQDTMDEAKSASEAADNALAPKEVALSSASDSYVADPTSGDKKQAVVDDAAGVQDGGVWSDDAWNPKYKASQSAAEAYQTATTNFNTKDAEYASARTAYQAAANERAAAAEAKSAAARTYNSSTYWDLNTYHGVVSEDYFTYVDINTGREYFYIVTSNLNGCRVMYYLDENDGSIGDPIILSGEVGLAQETILGGFYDVPDTAADYGYVHLDSDGHLRLVDYELLRSGTLAYQFGEDYEVPAGLTAEETQNYLDNYVNDRVVFPNSAQYAKYPNTYQNPEVIHLTLTLSDENSEDAPQDLYIRNLDSRFGGSIYLHINGTASRYTTIHLLNCEKIRIDSAINGIEDGNHPTVHVHNCCLYYDAGLLDELIDEDGIPTTDQITFWYERYYNEDGTSDDPDIEVDGMTIRSTSKEINTDSIEGWTDEDDNDNHYVCALKSITYNNYGVIIGAGIYLADETTNTTTLGKFAYASAFRLPQGTDLIYPESRLLKPIKIVGSFISTYTSSNSTSIVAENTFTALSQYNRPNSTGVGGTIVFRREVDELVIATSASIINSNVLEASESGQLTIFNGEAIY